jgi:glycosyltransferase involved in cell wall biosynthesis
VTSRKHRAVFVTILPSPYQRDLFAALAAREDVEVRVHYMEDAAPDSPWPRKDLRSFERIMPGFWAPLGGARIHVNWRLPDVSGADFVILSSFTSWTGQSLMRRRLKGRRWLFWGERLRQQDSPWRDSVQRTLAAPLARATAIVGIGREAETDYARRFPGLRTFCIPYHCDLSPFLSSTKGFAPAAPLTLLFCGQMIRRKGIDLLLTAVERVVKKGLGVRLLLVGREADLPQFLAAVSPETRARVHYEGFQPPERLPEYFARADVFVMPSRHDGWGVVVNQALGAGLPVITSDAVGAGLDLVDDGVNGLRFRAGDVEQLQQRLERLIASPETVRAWGAASRRRALDLTPEAGAEKWVRVFDSLSIH